MSCTVIISFPEFYIKISNIWPQIPSNILSNLSGKEWGLGQVSSLAKDETETERGNRGNVRDGGRGTGQGWCPDLILFFLPQTKSSMASTSRRQRRERRFRRYLSSGRLVRAQALLQRHPDLDVDAGQPPTLHRACARHDAPALCLLLRLGADPAHQDRHGDTALHAAARQGPDGESARWGTRPSATNWVWDESQQLKNKLVFWSWDLKW